MLLLGTLFNISYNISIYPHFIQVYCIQHNKIVMIGFILGFGVDFIHAQPEPYAREDEGDPKERERCMNKKR